MSEQVSPGSEHAMLDMTMRAVGGMNQTMREQESSGILAGVPLYKASDLTSKGLLAAMQPVFLEHKVSILSVTATHWQILRHASMREGARCVLKQKSDNEPTHGRGVLVGYARRKTDSGWVAFSQVPEVEGRGDSWSK